MGVGLLLLGFFVFWNRRLSREIALRSKTEADLTAAKESMRHSHQRLLLHREHTPLAVIEWNTGFEFLDWNPAAERMFGYTKEEVVGQHITERILPNSALEAVNEVWRQLLAQQGGTHSLNENLTKDGRTILCEWHNTPLVDHHGKVIGVTSLVDDITERRRAEENLRQTQKMDAMGKLTGGIAHDFNNMLSVIIGFAELLRDRLPDNEPEELKYCDQIIAATERSMTLTSTLLEFARKAPSSANQTNVNDLLRSMKQMLETTLTHRITLTLALSDAIWPVFLDKSRLEDAVLNMCINAMHAMPDGGSLTIYTGNRQLTGEKGLPPGDYMMLSIQDTGSGISKDVQLQMFDPFFTTKGAEGTGLGMSQVYGFVQQSNGHIVVHSELGQGTTIELYMPRLQAEEQTETTNPVEPELPTGHGTILVVDDEPALLTLTEQILSSHNYRVLCASGGEEALAILAAESVDLLLSDVIMPGMDGCELASEVGERFPNVKIQMISGYSEEPKLSRLSASLHQQRLHKPVKRRELLGRIQELLG